MARYRTRLLCSLLAATALVAGTASARRTSFVRAVIVASSDTPPPVGDEGWTQVPERKELNRVIQQPVPSWRNFWLPVRFDETYLDADTLNIADFYRNRGYLDAFIESTSLEPVSSESGMRFVNVLIVVSGIRPDQRFRLGTITLDGVASLDSASLREQFVKAHGKEGWFSPDASDHNLIDLRTAYADAGFLDSNSVRIDRHVEIDRAKRVVNVRYDVTEIAPVRVAGYRVVNGDAPARLMTDSSVIVQALMDAKLDTGRVFGRQRVLDAEANLADLGVFRRARVTPVSAEGAPATDKIASIDVSERDAWDINTRFGYSSVEKWRAKESVVYNNFLGQAKQIGEDGQYGRDQQTFTFFYSQPRIAIARWVPLVGGAGFRVRMDQSLTSDWELLRATTNLSTRTLQWKVALSRRIGAVSQFGVSYDFSRKDIGLSGPFSVGSDVSYLGTITLNGTYDTRDDYLNPTRGVSITTQVKFTNLGSGPKDTNVRPELLAQYYHKISRHLIAAFSAGGGFYYVGEIGKFDPLSQFWRSDQTPTVRGYTRDELTVGFPPDSVYVPYDTTAIGPFTVGKRARSLPAMAYLLGKVELRASVWRKVGVVGFLDIGQAWAPVSESDYYMRTIDGWSSMHRGPFAISIGFGPRIDWVLPMRFDFARPLRGPKKWRVEFGIGQAF